MCLACQSSGLLIILFLRNGSFYVQNSTLSYHRTPWRAEKNFLVVLSFQVKTLRLSRYPSQQTWLWIPGCLQCAMGKFLNLSQWCLLREKVIWGLEASFMNSSNNCSHSLSGLFSSLKVICQISSITKAFPRCPLANILPATFNIHGQSYFSIVLETFCLNVHCMIS